MPDQSSEKDLASPTRARKTRSFTRPSDDLMLAAVERAVLHQRKPDGSAGWGQVVEHLGFAKGSWTTRQLRPQAEALEAAGFLARSKRHGYINWGLTGRGRDRLDAVRRGLPVLPESPQHRVWREHRATAEQRIDVFRESLRGLARQTDALLDAGDETDSETWYTLGDRLHNICDRLASATHCVNEWSEPVDAKADVDEGGHPERRDAAVGLVAIPWQVE